MSVKAMTDRQNRCFMAISRTKIPVIGKMRPPAMRCANQLLTLKFRCTKDQTDHFEHLWIATRLEQPRLTISVGSLLTRLSHIRDFLNIVVDLVSGLNLRQR